MTSEWPLITKWAAGFLSVVARNTRRKPSIGIRITEELDNLNAEGVGYAGQGLDCEVFMAIFNPT